MDTIDSFMNHLGNRSDEIILSFEITAQPATIDGQHLAMSYRSD